MSMHYTTMDTEGDETASDRQSRTRMNRRQDYSRVRGVSSSIDSTSLNSGVSEVERTEIRHGLAKTSHSRAPTSERKLQFSKPKTHGVSPEQRHFSQGKKYSPQQYIQAPDASVRNMNLQAEYIGMVPSSYAAVSEKERFVFRKAGIPQIPQLVHEEQLHPMPGRTYGVMAPANTISYTSEYASDPNPTDVNRLPIDSPASMYKYSSQSSKHHHPMRVQGHVKVQYESPAVTSFSTHPGHFSEPEDIRTSSGGQFYSPRPTYHQPVYNANSRTYVPADMRSTATTYVSKVHLERPLIRTCGGMTVSKIIPEPMRDINNSDAESECSYSSDSSDQLRSHPHTPVWPEKRKKPKRVKRKPHKASYRPVNYTDDSDSQTYGELSDYARNYPEEMDLQQGHYNIVRTSSLDRTGAYHTGPPNMSESYMIQQVSASSSRGYAVPRSSKVINDNASSMAEESDTAASVKSKTRKLSNSSVSRMSPKITTLKVAKGIIPPLATFSSSVPRNNKSDQISMATLKTLGSGDKENMVKNWINQASDQTVDDGNISDSSRTSWKDGNKLTKNPFKIMGRNSSSIKSEGMPSHVAGSLQQSPFQIRTGGPSPASLDGDPPRILSPPMIGSEYELGGSLSDSERPRKRILSPFPARRIHKLSSSRESESSDNGESNDEGYGLSITTTRKSVSTLKPSLSTLKSSISTFKSSGSGSTSPTTPTHTYEPEDEPTFIHDDNEHDLASPTGYQHVEPLSPLAPLRSGFSPFSLPDSPYSPSALSAMNRAWSGLDDIQEQDENSENTNLASRLADRTSKHLSEHSKSGHSSEITEETEIADSESPELTETCQGDASSGDVSPRRRASYVKAQFNAPYTPYNVPSLPDHESVSEGEDDSPESVKDVDNDTTPLDEQHPERIELSESAGSGSTTPRTPTPQTPVTPSDHEDTLTSFTSIEKTDEATGTSSPVVTEFAAAMTEDAATTATEATDTETVDTVKVRRRKKKITRPRIPTILSLEDAGDLLGSGSGDDKNKAAKEKDRKGSDGESVTAPSSGQSTPTHRMRSSSVVEQNHQPKLMSSEGGSSLMMQKADGKLQVRGAHTRPALPPVFDDMIDHDQGGDGDMPLSPDDNKSQGYHTISDAVASPNQSQYGYDNCSVSSGYAEHEIGDLNSLVNVDISEVTSLNGNKSVEPRSHSDPLSGARTNGEPKMIPESIVESPYRSSNSEPALNGKLVEEAAQLAAKSVPLDKKKAQSATLPTQVKKGHKNNKNKEVSPDECFDLDKTKKLQKAVSSPAATRKSPTTPKKEKEKTTERSKSDSGTTAEAKAAVKAAASPTKSPSAPGSPEKKATTAKPKPTKNDLRRHVLQNLLDTEKSYVQNLQTLISGFYKPLKRPESISIVEPSLVDEMFYQIPEILLSHEFFLEQLQARVSYWSDKQKIGDIFVQSFTKCLLMDAYSAFINHYLQARAAVRAATLVKPSFAKFLEQQTKEHREKLTLQDLMIMPVQRIPRYVLILKDMIKHTPADHPDHGNLQLALGEIKTLAERMNKGEMEADQAERESERLRDIEATIEGITDLVSPKRRFIRQDLVAEVKGAMTKKDRCLFLFTDLLVCATVKRKPTALRRGSLGLFSSQSGTEFNKYRLLWRIALEDIDIYSTNSLNSTKPVDRQKEILEDDVKVLSQISALTDNLKVAHQSLDMAIRDLISDVNKQVVDRQQIQPTLLSPAKVELSAQTEDGIEIFVFLFLSAEIKSSWEAYFEDAKQKLAYAKDTFPPEFQYVIPITKTRSGMQFTCASPSLVPHVLDRVNHCGSGNVWVCNSDGYVGQVCVLTMQPEIQPIASVTVCNSRILCIHPIPGGKLKGIETVTDTPQELKTPRTSNAGLSRSQSFVQPRAKPARAGPCYASDTDLGNGAEQIMAFDSSSDEDEGLDNGDGFITTITNISTVYTGRVSPDRSSLGMGSVGDGGSSANESDADSSDGNKKKKKGKTSVSSPSNSTRRRKKSQVVKENDCAILFDSDSEESSTVWLGTEDGSVYVYPVTEAFHTRKTKMKIPLTAAIHCILYIDNQVFVALANGDLCIYKRLPGAAWDVGQPHKVHVNSSNASVTCMTAVHGRLWCGCQSNVVVLNTTTLLVENSFTASLDSHRSVYRMVSSGMGVWVSMQSSAVVRLFHAQTFENLADVDVAPAVHKMLAGSDAIIRQHKAACLRITALLACKDLLWIGTSAGVVLTLPLPIITSSTMSLRNCPNATASFHGHTGHVRFLTAVEVGKTNKEGDKQDPPPSATSTPCSTLSRGSSMTSGYSTASLSSKDSKGKLIPPGLIQGNNILIVSGGDGYEDFRLSSSSESAGRDDSTNHLLIWRV